MAKQKINVLQSTVSNASLDTTAGNIGGAWLTWTPSFTNISGGTITVAKYTLIGKTCHFIMKYTMAGAGVAGNASFTLPVTAHADFVAGTILGTTRLDDNGTGTKYGMLVVKSNADCFLYVYNVAGTYLDIGALSSTVPHTWAVNDSITCNGTYEIA